MRFWWLSDCNCSAPLRARACCGVPTKRSRPGLATSFGVEFGCSQTKKAAQKWQNNSNAQEKVTQKEMLERAYMERLMATPTNVKQIRGGEY